MDKNDFKNQLQITSAENIALFSLLHDVPVRPSTNKAISSLNLPIQQTSRRNYKLSFDTERRLADILAFLASIEDDPNYIPAVCVGEDQDEKNLNVYIAINKRHWNDGDGLLQDTKQKFEKIFHLLENGSFQNQDEYGHNRRNFKEQVFSAVVSMCYSRILARLCLNAKKNFKETLVEVINCVNRQIRNPNTENSLPLFATKARELVKLVDLWTNYQTPSRLENVVEGVYQLQKTETVQLVLDGMSNKEMDPSRRGSLLNIIKKVARYRQAARFLYRLVAKERHKVSRLKAIPVTLPKEQLERPLQSADYRPQFSSVLSRIHPQYAKEKNLSQIRRLLTKKEESVDEEFSKRTFKILNKAKIHAEVQLIAHCEFCLPVSVLPPRVICSSKDACYLCNLTIPICRGKTYTPRSHGRLYSGWRLPLQNQQLAVGFNQTLETKIQESLMILLQKQERINYLFPMESTLGTLPPSNTTLCTSINNGSVASRIGRRHGVPVRALQAVENPEPTYWPSLEPTSVRSPDQKSQSDGLFSDIQAQNLHLSNGESLLPRIIDPKKTIKSQNASFLSSNGRLEVQIELDPPDPSGLAIDQKKVVYSIEWLDETVEIEEKCHSGCVIDAGALQGEVFHELCSQNNLYMTFKNGVFRLSVYS